MNRETWLNDLATLMTPRFEELGFPIPKFRVAVGWTSAGKSTKLAGECWHSSNSADKAFEILIAPTIDNSMEVAATLVHELCHAAAGFKHGHKGEFAKLMAALGLLRPFTACVPGPDFKAWSQPFLDKLGSIPHARIMLQPERSPREEGDDQEDADEDGGSSNQKKKQTTRMLKATCQAIGPADGSGNGEGKPCGYTVRLSKKWAKELGACCPVHGGMDVEGMDEDDGGEGED